MKNFHKLIALVLSLTLMSLISGCGGGGGSSDTSTATGVLSLSITDAKPRLPEAPTAVNIKVIGIEYNHDENWIEVENFEPVTINLLEWQNGKSISLGDFELPVGHYKEIRFKLAAPVKKSDVKSNPDCNITFETADTVPLFAPSAAQSGYKGKGDFDITANARIAVTADWDVGRAIVVTGSDKYILHPVVQLFVTELSGEINGTVVDVEKYGHTDDELVVYAYENGNYKDDEENLVEEVRFLNAVSSSDVNMTDGNFSFSFLEEGNYSLVTAQYEGDTFIDVVDRKDDVEVFKGKVTLVDVNTSD